MLKPRLVTRLLLRLRRMASWLWPERVVLSGATINLPPFHPLKSINVLHPRYDKFLPFLASKLRDGSTVVDVGGNVGDTAVRLSSANSMLKIDLFEPSKDFLDFAVQNCRSNGLENVNFLNLAVGSKEKIFVDLKSGSGARTTSAQASPAIMISLDVFYKGKDVDIDLIKIDTDGWDWDVIASSYEVIRRFKPIIFFELQVISEESFAGYREALFELLSCGYSLYVFDNIGNFIFTIDDEHLIEQKLTYLVASKNTDKAIPYYDICCGHSPEQKLLIDNTIRSFLVGEF